MSPPPAFACYFCPRICSTFDEFCYHTNSHNRQQQFYPNRQYPRDYGRQFHSPSRTPPRRAVKSVVRQQLLPPPPPPKKKYMKMHNGQNVHMQPRYRRDTNMTNAPYIRKPMHSTVHAPCVSVSPGLLIKDVIVGLWEQKEERYQKVLETVEREMLTGKTVSAHVVFQPQNLEDINAICSC